MTPERLKPLKELADCGKAWIRTSEDAVTPDGARVSPFPDLSEVFAYITHLEKYKQHLPSCELIAFDGEPGVYYAGTGFRKPECDCGLEGGS